MRAMLFHIIGILYGQVAVWAHRPYVSGKCQKQPTSLLLLTSYRDNCSEDVSPNCKFIKTAFHNTEDLDEVIDMFKGDGKFTKREAQELTDIIMQFERHDETLLTATLRQLLVDTLRLFAGPDKKFQEEEIEDLKEVIGNFAGKIKPLNDPEAKMMFRVIQLFDTDGNGGLDRNERSSLKRTLQLFAGHDEGNEIINIEEAKKVIRIVKLFSADGIGRGENSTLERTLELFAGEDEKLNSKEISDMEEVINFFNIDDNMLTKEDEERMLAIITAFDMDGDNSFDMAERTYMLTTLRYFGGQKREVGKCEAEDLQTLIVLVGGFPQLQAGEAMTMLEVLKLFDTDNNGFLDEEERKSLIKMGHYFAGDDNILEEAELLDMKKVMGFFDGTDDDLQKDELKNMVATVVLFDYTGDGKLDQRERKELLLTTQYFAGEDGELEEHELRDMKLVIGYFDGVDNKLQVEEANAMLQVLKMFDSDGNQKFNDLERDALVKTTRYFAGNDEELNEEEIVDMEKVIALFSGGDDVLQKDEAKAMLKTIDLFDTDGNGSLDDEERVLLVRSCQYFGGDDGKLDSRELRDINEVFGLCKGEDGKLRKQKAQSTVDMINDFDSDSNDILDEEERGYVITTLKYFAGEDKQLDSSELKDMKEIIELFKQDKKVSKTEVRDMMDVLELFDMDQNSAFDDLERDSLLTMARHFAGEDRLLNHEEISEMIKVIKFFLTGDNVRSKAKAHDLLRAMLKHVTARVHRS